MKNLPIEEEQKLAEALKQLWTFCERDFRISNGFENDKTLRKWIHYDNEDGIADINGDNGPHRECDEKVGKGKITVVDDAASIGDIPTVVPNLRAHELPVIGTFIHPRIVQGFCYIVRSLDSNKFLFQGKALCLKNIGAGYGKRLTFEDSSSICNDNYFWSDSRAGGYGFAIQLIHRNDKFIVRDVNDMYIGTVRVEELLGPQIEIAEHFRGNKTVEKEARVNFKCSISYSGGDFHSREFGAISGTAVAAKDVQSRERASVIRGLLDHEMPVIGTYVDPRIAPGFKYRVRPLQDSKKYLFNRKALALLSVGKGYGKRITFSGESFSDNYNFFWSDSNPEGYAFTIEAVSPGDVFRIEDENGMEVGRAEVYTTDSPQIEMKCVVLDGRYTKLVRVCISCHLSIFGNKDLTTAVAGIATIERRGRTARVKRIDNIAIGSQINDLLKNEKISICFIN